MTETETGIENVEETVNERGLRAILHEIIYEKDADGMWVNDELIGCAVSFATYHVEGFLLNSGTAHNATASVVDMLYAVIEGRETGEIYLGASE